MLKGAWLLMLNERQTKVLFCVVNEFIKTRKPVSSSKVIESTTISQSSATVRNDLKKLEYLGYVHHIHTSSGRVPTDQGYRFYVNSIFEMMKDSEYSRKIEIFPEYPHGNIEQIVTRVATLLSRSVPSTVIITKPRTDTLKIKSIRLHKSSEDYTTIVMSTELGMVSSQTVINRIGDSDLEGTEKFLNGSLIGRTIEELRDHLKDEENYRKWKGTNVENVLEILKSLVEESSEERYVVRGLENLVADEIIEQDDLRRLVNVLETPDRFYGFFDKYGEIAEIEVFVGSEHPQKDMDIFSSFVMPYKAFSETIGHVLVISSKATDYQKNITLTQYVGNRLTELFTFLSRVGGIKR